MKPQPKIKTGALPPLPVSRARAAAMLRRFRASGHLVLCHLPPGWRVYVSADTCNPYQIAIPTP